MGQRLVALLAFPALALLLTSLIWPDAAAAAGPCATPAGQIVSLEGLVEVRQTRTADWTPARLNAEVCPGGAVRTGPLSRAAVVLPNESVLRLDAETSLALRQLEEREPSLLDLLRGAVYFFSYQPERYRIETAFANAGAEGTEFLVRTTADHTDLLVFDGRVVVRNDQGEITLAQGDAARAASGAPPAPLIVARPEDAVAWAIYYPPVLTAVAASNGAAGLPNALARAVAAANADDYQGALAALDEVPEAERDAQYDTYRAGILLNVGRVDAAGAAIERALAAEPENAGALAQRAVIRIARGDSSGGLEDAERALALAPDSAPAAVALSYALQANFRLDDAQDVLTTAAEATAGDPLVLARLAEIELSLGNLNAALAAAERAAVEAPNLARTQTVLGFAALVSIEIDDARAAFERAVELDPAGPMPRLGLGLTKIRTSDLDQGRRDLQIAVGLDPMNSLIRSYLGKAFFEERRGPKAADQLQIAKRLDPNDPTPWFYDAILKQTENRPVEAFRDLEKAIALNDNRAIYRSRLLLDEDLASRGVSLARIYDDLGFDQVARNEASRSLAVDAGNWSAHRFLSDAFAALPRHEIARASELLQSQLLQPINLNPLQPGLAFTDLNVIEGVGPTTGAFNEFNSLFVRNRPQLTATGVFGDGEGNENTFGGEAVASGVYNRYSLSIGGSGFQTDGFRENNDLENSVFDAFGQVAITPQLNVQAEYRYRDTSHGDLRLDFDPDDFSLDTTRTIKDETGRIGLRYSPQPGSDLLFSAFYTKRRQTGLEDFGFTQIGTEGEDSGYQIEGQYLYSRPQYDLALGGAGYDIDVEEELDLSSFGGGIRRDAFTRSQQKFYTYFNLRLPSEVTWTFGASVDSFEQRGFGQDLFNPKFGVQWDVTPALTLRAAAFQTVKPALSVQQTLEPTNIAGFNQFFDDFNGARSRTYAGGLDIRVTSDLYAGLEYRHRDVQELGFAGVSGATKRDRSEDGFLTYLYWAPLPRWDATLETRFARFDQDFVVSGVPAKLDTIEVPLVVRYFHPSGLFGQLGATYLHQDVDGSPSDAAAASGTENTALLDAAVGFRLPDRYGILSLEGRNLLDEEFNYQSIDFLTSERRAPRFVPARVVVGRVTLTF